jgi:hypothetical protein
VQRNSRSPFGDDNKKNNCKSPVSQCAAVGSHFAGGGVGDRLVSLIDLELRLRHQRQIYTDRSTGLARISREVGVIGNFELFAAQRTLHRRIPAKIRFEGLAREERFGGCTQPDGDRLRSWIGTAEHTISKITRPPQTGFHSGRRFDAAFRRFNRR